MKLDESETCRSHFSPFHRHRALSCLAMSMGELGCPLSDLGRQHTMELALIAKDLEHYFSKLLSRRSKVASLKAEITEDMIMNEHVGVLFQSEELDKPEVQAVLNFAQDAISECESSPDPAEITEKDVSVFAVPFKISVPSAQPRLLSVHVQKFGSERSERTTHPPIKKPMAPMETITDQDLLFGLMPGEPTLVHEKVSVPQQIRSGCCYTQELPTDAPLFFEESCYGQQLPPRLLPTLPDDALEKKCSTICSM
jgi:hypothetical protein